MCVWGVGVHLPFDDPAKYTEIGIPLNDVKSDKRTDSDTDWCTTAYTVLAAVGKYSMHQCITFETY